MNYWPSKPSKDDLRTALAVLRAEYAYAETRRDANYKIGLYQDGGVAAVKQKIDWIRLQLSEA